MKTIHSILNTLSTIFFGSIIVILFFTYTSNNAIFGGNQSFVVKSGSMEPTIMTGDIIVIKPQPQYNLNDVITFKEGADRIVTHRIIDIAQKSGTPEIATKGDANRSLDNDKITQSNIVGKVQFVVPKIGFLVAFTHTTPGLVVMIIIPVILLVMDQFVQMSMRQNRT